MQNLTGDSGEGSEDQYADRNEDSKGYTIRFQMKMRTPLGIEHHGKVVGFLLCMP